MTDYDYEILAKTIFGEARGESFAGQVAIACVVINRWKAHKWFSGKSIASTCLKPYQFSCWNKSDPNSQILAKLPYTTYSKYFPAIKEAINNDITVGATHYHVRGLNPAWAKNHKPCKQIGAHLFYNDIE